MTWCPGKDTGLEVGGAGSSSLDSQPAAGLREPHAVSGLSFSSEAKDWGKRLIFLCSGPRGAPWSPGSWWEIVLAAGFLDLSISALAPPPFSLGPNAMSPGLGLFQRLLYEFLRSIQGPLGERWVFLLAFSLGRHKSSVSL